MSQRGLLLIAHGSRRVAANHEVQRLTERLREQLKSSFSLTEYAFLELAKPNIPEGLQTLIDGGAEDIVVLPYFLTAGNHVAEDIPAAVAAKQAEYPGIKLRLSPYLGASDELTDLLARSAREQVSV